MERDASEPLAPVEVGFLLIKGFPMLSFSSGLEPFRVANWVMGRELYSWSVFTVDDTAVSASNGLSVTPSAPIAGISRASILIVCAGVGGHYCRDKQIFGSIRLLARNGTAIGGIGTAPFILARSGVLTGYRCTVHWQEIENFRREFPNLDVTGNAYEVDRKRLTCSAGTAAMDMVLHVISERHGPTIAGEVAHQFTHRGASVASPEQRTDPANGVLDPRLLRIISLMDQHIEDPLSIDEICIASEASRRNLQRLFKNELGCPPTDFYRKVRLRHARNMLLHGSVSIMDVAIASGFVSASHFCRCYRAQFGLTPSEERHRQSMMRRKVAAARW